MELAVRLPTCQEWGILDMWGRKAVVERIVQAIVMAHGVGAYPKVPSTCPQVARAVERDRCRRQWGRRYPLIMRLVVRRPDGGVPVELSPLLNAVQSAGWAVSDHPKWLVVESHAYCAGDHGVFMEMRWHDERDERRRSRTGPEPVC